MREREHGTGILFEEPNPTGSRPRDLIAFIQEGNRTPVAKATHSRRENVFAVEKKKHCMIVAMDYLRSPLTTGTKAEEASSL